MAIDAIQRLRARREATYHVQVKIISLGAAPPTVGEIVVQGRITRVFRTNNRLKEGDSISFALPVLREGGHHPPGRDYFLHSHLVEATHLEAYLDGEPPHCEVCMDECSVIPGPSTSPTMSIRELETSLGAKLASQAEQPKMKRWWKFWS